MEDPLMPPPVEAVRKAGRARQFSAILHKNLLLQTRSSRAFFGVRLGGAAAVFLEWLVPVLFILAMYPLKSFLPKVEYLPLVFKAIDLQSSEWGTVYSGPNFVNDTVVLPKLLLAPDVPPVRHVAKLLVKALACGPASYVDPQRSQDFRQFWRSGMSAKCITEEAYCQHASECTAHILQQQIAWSTNASTVAAALLQQPQVYDAAVVLEPASLAYEIRMNHTFFDFISGHFVDMPSTQDVFSDISIGQVKMTVEPDMQYRTYFFFTNLQLALDRAIMALHLEGNSTKFPLNVEVKAKAFPWPEKEVDVGGVLAGFLFIFLLVFAFQQPTSNMVAVIVREKELRLREYMYILGLSDSAYWLSWWVTHAALLGVSGLLCAIAGRYPFSKSSLWIMMIFYISVSNALISFAYCIASLFSSSRVASIATPMLYALAMIPGFLATSTQTHGGVVWYLASLLPPSAMTLFSFSLISWEVSGQGIRGGTVFSTVTPALYFSSASVIGMLILDTFLYFGLMLILDWGSHGNGFAAAVCNAFQSMLVSKPEPMLSPSYHGSTRGSRGGGSASQHGGNAYGSLGSNTFGSQGIRERADSAPGALGDPLDGSDASNVAIHMEKLSRSFRTEHGLAVAVDRLELDIYEGQITALLGHNGAGKSTTISMLTGVLPPSSGQALIGGRSIKTSMAQIRESLGVCPQFDILWPLLTVREHLQLYAALRGFPADEVGRVADNSAQEVGLTAKLAAQASDLSGGEKRRLSLAISLLGSPAVIFLDEPTSGMDPQGRRFIWDVIRRAKAGRAVVLTTHSMDEADMLCDRIAIMTHGRLAAVGSSLQLKAMYGTGYSLTIVRDHAKGRAHAAAAAPAERESGAPQVAQIDDISSHRVSVDSMSTVSTLHSASPTMRSLPGQGGARALVEGGDLDIEDLVLRHVPDAVAVSHAGDELSFQLPQSHVHAFPALLREIERHKAQLNMRSYGLSVTTMEEVFLHIACDSDDSLRTHLGSLASVPRASNASSAAPLSGPADGASAPTDGAAAHDMFSRSGRATWCSEVLLWFRQFRACLVKHSLAARRERWAIMTQVVVPLLLVLGAIYLGKRSFTPDPDPPLLLDHKHALDGWNGTLGAPYDVRNQSEFAALASILEKTYGYNDTLSHALDPALWPYGVPQNHTLDAQLNSEWYNNTHIYDAIFVDQLPIAPMRPPLPPLQPALDRNNSSAYAPSTAAPPSTARRLHSASVLHTMASANHRVDEPNSVHALEDAKSVAYVQPNGRDAATLRGQEEGRNAAERMKYGGAAVEDFFFAPFVYTIMNNETAKHAMPVTINAMNNAILDALLRQRGDSRSKLLKAYSHPYPVVPEEEKVRISKENAQMNLAVYIMMALSALSASFVVVPVKERSSGSRHVQIVSGLMPSALWMSTLLWDLLVYSIPASAMLGCFYVADVPGVSGDHLPVMAALLLFFGLAALPQTYLWHYLFADEMRALVRLSSTNSMLGFLGFSVTFILDKLVEFGLPSSRDSLKFWDDAIKGVLHVASPHYVLMYALFDLLQLPQGRDPWAAEVTGSKLRWLAWQAVVLLAAQLLVASGWLEVLGWRCLRLGARGARKVGLRATESGSSGRMGLERENTSGAAADANPDEYMVVLRDVTKLYHDEWLGWKTPLRAVDGVSMAVKRGEFLGLLGSNGAGKSTVFKMLTHALRPSAGDISLAGRSVTRDPALARRCTGYCPQFGGLTDALTGRELLTFYARLRGVPPAEIDDAVGELLERLSLTEYADRACGVYSGGNRRKLSVAVALIGSPQILLLDEPSTGMCPAARRSLWVVLQDAQHAGHTIVMTSHMMEECDVLCTSIAILAKGKLRCFGPTQEMKLRYGGGYVLEARLPRRLHAQLQGELQEAFPDASIAASGDRWSDVACLALEQDRLDVPALFEFVERNREKLQIGTYAISQGTLEHVFMRVMKDADSVSLPLRGGPEST